MEWLNISLQRANQSQLICGIPIGRDGIQVSRLFYTDDGIILSDWDEDCTCNIILIFWCFFLASDLKINFLKIKLIVVGMIFFIRWRGVWVFFGVSLLNSIFLILVSWWGFLCRGWMDYPRLLILLRISCQDGMQNSCLLVVVLLFCARC